jgi:energy-coupling factor transporter ATP-binding protein EcfA2
LITGSSGCGKSTFLRCVNGLVPHFSGGEIAGTIRVNGMDPAALGPQIMSRQVGFVFQDPEAQFVVDQVEDEIAFALENAALPRHDMSLRVQAILEALDLVKLRSHRLDSLSGGERQRVAIASALAIQPSVLLLDEPTSQLDPEAAEELLEILVTLKDRLGLTILLVEHRLERILPFTDKLIYLEAGVTGAVSGPPRQVLKEIPLNPPLVALAKALDWDQIPLTIEEARGILQTAGRAKSPRTTAEPAPPLADNSPIQHLQPPILDINGLVAGYNRENVLQGVDLAIYPSEILVLMGPNGAGKSTLLRCVSGLTRSRQGSIRLLGQETSNADVAQICTQLGYLPQDPNALLFADTVMDELLISLRNHNISALDYPPIKLLQSLGIENLAASYPRDLSAGERQRTAMGAIMIALPKALLLDEPTRGLDYAAKQSLVDLLNSWRDAGMAILVVTHDVELAATLANRVAWMEDGKITRIGSPQQIFPRTGRFAPQIAQLFPDSGWITISDDLAML